MEGWKYLSELIGNIKTRIILGKKNFKEVKELVTDLKTNFSKDVKLNIKSKDNVVVTAAEGANHIKVDMNFAEDKMVQEMFTKNYPLSLVPNQENTAIARGTIDGNVLRTKNIDLRSNAAGEFIETTDIVNLVSGNAYRRTRTPNSTVYQKCINGNYVNLFPKV